MRRCTSKITKAWQMRCATCERTSRFTITSGFIKRWTIKHKRRSIQADKTDILEWLCFVLFSTKNCLDFWDHHSTLPSSSRMKASVSYSSERYDEKTSVDQNLLLPSTRCVYTV